MYLENIFIGSEDIRKQLPQESLMFEGVHHAFMRSMAWLHSVGNVVQATTGQGVLAAFQVCAAPAMCQQKGAAGDARVIYPLCKAWLHSAHTFVACVCIPVVCCHGMVSQCVQSVDQQLTVRHVTLLLDAHLTGLLAACRLPLLLLLLAGHGCQAGEGAEVAGELPGVEAAAVPALLLPVK
jgi:hypothetical protein